MEIGRNSYLRQLTRISNAFASERQYSYTNKTISKHIDYLEEAFLISKSNRYNIKGRKYIGANLKYYAGSGILYSAQ